MLSVSQPRKRQFQPTIDTFFARADRDSFIPTGSNGDSTSSFGGRDSIQAAQHALPPEVQTNLLMVGMRIRKAVPEGYKTHKTAPVCDHTPVAIASRGATPITPARRAAVAELMPFCGLHKIGGLGVQGHGDGYGHSPAPSAPVDAWGVSGDAQNDMLVDPDAAFFFSSSQESTTSTLSTDSMPACKPHKRRFAEYEHADDDEAGSAGCEPAAASYDQDFAFAFVHPALDIPVSPLTTSFPIAHAAARPPTQFDWNALVASSRPRLKPRSRRKAGHDATTTYATATADENTNPLTAAANGDFEDAAFLVPPWQDDRMDLA